MNPGMLKFVVLPGNNSGLIRDAMLRRNHKWEETTPNDTCYHFKWQPVSYGISSTMYQLHSLWRLTLQIQKCTAKLCFLSWTATMLLRILRRKSSNTMWRLRSTMHNMQQSQTKSWWCKTKTILLMNSSFSNTSTTTNEDSLSSISKMRKKPKIRVSKNICSDILSHSVILRDTICGY
mgnify:CR=1 FL=1